MATLETEAMFSEWVDQARTLGGWLATHFRAARAAGGYVTPLTGDKGFPDWTLVHPDGRLIFAELKGERGTLEPHQRSWLNHLANAALPRTHAAEYGFDVCLWRPADKPEIEDVLLRRQRPTATRYLPTPLAQPDRLPMEAT